MTFSIQLWALYGIEIFLLLLWVLWRYKVLTEELRNSGIARKAWFAHKLAAVLAVLTLAPMLMLMPDSDDHRSLLTFLNLPFLGASILCVVLYARTTPPNRSLAPPTELELTPQRLPKTVWLAVIPPLLMAALIFWLSAHWDQIPSRYSVDASPLERQSEFRMLRLWLLLPCMMGVSALIHGIAQWYGTARTPASRARFDWAVSHSWTATLWIPAVMLPTQFGLSWKSTPWCVLSASIGLGIALWARRRLKKFDVRPDDYTGWYFDRHDPALWGSRGTNVGNPWQWALFAVHAVPMVVPFFLL
ncbi:MAG: hypothetical protein ABI824_04405 [Acidobacteriota bacterium]